MSRRSTSAPHLRCQWPNSRPTSRADLVHSWWLVTNKHMGIIAGLTSHPRLTSWFATSIPRVYVVCMYVCMYVCMIMYVCTYIVHVSYEPTYNGGGGHLVWAQNGTNASAKPALLRIYIGSRTIHLRGLYNHLIHTLESVWHPQTFWIAQSNFKAQITITQKILGPANIITTHMKRYK